MFFKKHKKNKIALSSQRIMDMRQSGLSDRDILKKLRKEGYSYDNIERAMLQSVKSGVEDSEEVPTTMPETPQIQSEFVPSPFQTQENSNVNTDLFNEQPQSETVDPEGIIEELVESIVEEKTDSIFNKIKKLENKINEVHDEVKNAKNISSKSNSQNLTPKFNEFTDKLDELDARISGLEKAFNQFLPVLTKNIDSLANMIHELKKKTRQLGE